MFKELVKLIAAVKDVEDFDAACGKIDQMFDKGRITWQDHELLHDLLGKIKLA